MTISPFTCSRNFVPSCSLQSWKSLKFFSCTCWLLPPSKKNMLFSLSPARTIDTFSKVEGAVVAFFSRHTNVFVCVFGTGMLMRNRYAYAISCRCCHYMTLRCRLFSVPRAGAAARTTVVRWSVTKQSSVFFSHWNHRGHR